MKGKSLLKKIAAVATTAAMLASVSVVGFAAPEDGDGDGFAANGKVTGTVTYEENQAKTAFDFTVAYAQNATTDNVGVTMFAYKVSTGDTIANGYTRDGADVVGIAQNGVAEAKKEFTFSVTKGDEARELDYGDEVIILLSSDGAANAVGYLTKITGTTDVVEVNGTTFEVELPYYEANDAANVAAALNDIDNPSVNVIIGEGTTENVSAVGITAVGTPVCTEGAWTVEVTLGAITGTNLSVAAGKKVTVPVTVNKTAWTATSATIAADIIPYDSEAEITEVPAMLTAITNLVKDGRHFITFTGADGHTVDWEVPANATVAWKGETPTTIEQGETYTVTVTLAEALTLDDVVATAPQGLAADFTITYQADTRWAVDSAELQKVADSSEVTEITIEYADAPADKTALETAVAALINGDTYKVVVSDESGENTNVVTSDVTVAAVDAYTKPAIDSTEDVAVTVTVTVPTSATFETADTTKITDAKSFDIEIVVKAAGPAWACGDVDHKNGVNEFDATAILRYLAGGYDGYEYVAERTHEADTDRKNGINEFDATTILRHLAGGYPGYETLPKQ